MAVILFMPRFHAAVESGAKRQTIRGTRKRVIPPGAPLSLRAWEGKPYRSPQRVLREARCVSVEPIVIRYEPFKLVEIAGVLLDPPRTQSFVRADGFENISDFRQWWVAHRMFPFEGILIRWEPFEPAAETEGTETEEVA